MTPRLRSLPGCALLLCSVCAPAWSDSVISAGLSASVSTSVGSVSDSFGKSSAGSSRQDRARADGDYRVIDVAAVPDRPGMVRLLLQATAERGGDRIDDGALDLVLPRGVADRVQLTPGQRVSARQRPYGVEFVHGVTRQAFFLVLDDDWLREIPPQAVRL